MRGQLISSQPAAPTRRVRRRTGLAGSMVPTGTNVPVASRNRRPRQPAGSRLSRKPDTLQAQPSK